MVDATDPLAVAAALFSAIEAGDIDAVRELYADDVVIWHNTDGASQGRDENLRILGWISRHLTAFRYEDIKRDPTPGGFVQRHVLRATNPMGDAVEIPACIVGTVVAGRITRIDEYLDSAHVARITAASPR